MAMQDAKALMKLVATNFSYKDFRQRMIRIDGVDREWIFYNCDIVGDNNDHLYLNIFDDYLGEDFIGETVHVDNVNYDGDTFFVQLADEQCRREIEFFIVQRMHLGFDE